MRFLILGVLVLTASAAPALAESRGYTITSFDKIRVAGPFTVNLRTGARARSIRCGSRSRAARWW
jgi:hypothetical protein